MNTLFSRFRRALEHTITLTSAVVTLSLSCVWYFFKEDMSPLITIVGAVGTLLVSVMARINTRRSEREKEESWMTQINKIVENNTSDEFKRIRDLQGQLLDDKGQDSIRDQERAKLEEEIKALKADLEAKKNLMQEILLQYKNEDLVRSTSLYRRAFSYFTQGEFTKALDVLHESTIAIEEDHVSQLRRLKGNIFSLSKNMAQEARDHYIKASMVHASWENHYATASHLHRMNLPHEALEFYSESLPHANDDVRKAKSLHGIGRLQFDVGDLEEAQMTLKKLNDLYKNLATIDSVKYNPLVAESLMLLGLSYYFAHDTETGEEIYQQVYEAYRALSESDYRAHGPMFGRAVISFAGAQADAGNPNLADTNYKKGLVIVGKLYEINSDDFTKDYGEAILTYATFLQTNGLFKDADLRLSEAASLFRQLAQKLPDQADPLLAETVVRQATVKKNLHDPLRSEEHFREALPILRRLIHAADRQQLLAPMAYVLIELRSVSNTNDDIKEMIGYENEILELADDLIALDAKKYERNIALILGHVANWNGDNGEELKARQQYEKAVSIYRGFNARDIFDYDGDFADLLADFAIFLKSINEIQLARQCFQESITINKRRGQENGPEFYLMAVNSSTVYALLELDQKDLGSAKRIIVEAKQLLEGIQESHELHKSKAPLLAMHGLVMYRLGDTAQAESSYLESIELFDILMQAGRYDAIPHHAEALLFLGELKMRQADTAQAETYFMNAISIILKIKSPNNIDIPDIHSRALLSLGQLYNQLQRFNEAENHLNKSLTILRSLPRSSKFICNTAVSLLELGSLNFFRGDNALAEAHYSEGVELLESIGAINFEKYANLAATALIHLGSVQEDEHKFSEATTNYQKSIMLLEELASSTSEKFVSELATAKSRLGDLLIKSDIQMAEMHLQQSYDLISNKPNKTIDEESLHADILGVMATLNFNKGDVTKAEKYYLDSLALRKKITNLNVAEYEIIEGRALNSAGVFFCRFGKTKLGRDCLLQASDIFRRYAEGNSEILLFERTTTLMNLAIFSQPATLTHPSPQDYMDEAISLLRPAARKMPNKYVPSLAFALMEYPGLPKGGLDEKHGYLAESVFILRQLFLEYPDQFGVQLSDALWRLGVIEGERGNFSGIESNFMEAYAILREVATSNPGLFLPQLPLLQVDIAWLYSQSHKPQAAETFLCAALYAIEPFMHMEWVPDLLRRIVKILVDLRINAIEFLTTNFEEEFGPSLAILKLLPAEDKPT